MDMDDIFKKALKKKQRPMEVGVFHASGISGCPRKIYYGYIFPKEYDLKTLKIFHIGHKIHELLQKLIEENSEFERVEVEKPVMVTDIETDLNIHGRIDLVGYNKTDKIVVEIKSINSLHYIEEDNKPNQHHVEQLQVYLRCMRAKKGLLVYVEKSNLNIKTFYVEYDDELFKNILKRLRLIYKCQKEGSSPNRIDGYPSNWECRYCKFKKECSSEGDKNGGIEICGKV